MPFRAVRHRYGGSGRGGFTHVPSGVAPVTALIQRRRLARPYSIGRRRPARQMSGRSGALAPVPGRPRPCRFSLDVFMPSCRCRRVEDLHLPGATRALVTSLPGAGDRRAAGEQPRRGGHGATAFATREPDRSGRAVLAVIARPPARSRRSVGRTEMGRVGPGPAPPRPAPGRPSSSWLPSAQLGDGRPRRPRTPAPSGAAAWRRSRPSGRSGTSPARAASRPRARHPGPAGTAPSVSGAVASAKAAATAGRSGRVLDMPIAPLGRPHAGRLDDVAPVAGGVPARLPLSRVKSRLARSVIARSRSGCRGRGPVRLARLRPRGDAPDGIPISEGRRGSGCPASGRSRDATRPAAPRDRWRRGRSRGRGCRRPLGAAPPRGARSPRPSGARWRWRS